LIVAVYTGGLSAICHGCSKKFMIAKLSAFVPSPLVAEILKKRNAVLPMLDNFFLAIALIKQAGNCI